MRFSFVLPLWVALCFPAHAQDSSFSRFTPDLTQQLETDAASAASRALYIEFAVVVCPRASREASDLLRVAAAQWRARNEQFLKAGVAALAEIGERHVPQGGKDQKQGYLHSVVRTTVANAKSELTRDFNGATPDNQLLPPESRCLALAEGLNAGRVDFVNTPKATMALEPYMRRRQSAPQ
jgi:hypothetical protein